MFFHPNPALLQYFIHKKDGDGLPVRSGKNRRKAKILPDGDS